LDEQDLETFLGRKSMNWLLESWHLLLPKPFSAILCALAAALCGAWVGIERERPK
jgi:hypothetical protein